MTTQSEQKMAGLQGFWSYVHDDDEAEGGRISRLARDLAAQFQLLTGEPIELFLDRDAIKWGEDWQATIDGSLASIAFFIPVMTPRYFMRPECRRELQFFARRATQLGVKELVLPLLYVDVPALHDEDVGDDLMAMVRTFQWEDWTDLRLADVTVEGYRRGVARLAERLVQANREAEKAHVFATGNQQERAGTETVEEPPGILDRLARAEETLAKLPDTIEAIVRDIELIGEIVQDGTGQIQQSDKQGKGFAGRMFVAHRVAGKLSEPTERIWSVANEFTSQLHDVDQGVRAIVEQAPEEMRERPESKVDLCAFVGAVRQLSDAARTAFGAIKELIDASTPLEKMSRDLRPPLRRLRQGLTVMVEAREITDEWVSLIDSAGIDCSAEDAEANVT